MLYQPEHMLSIWLDGLLRCNLVWPSSSGYESRVVSLKDGKPQRWEASKMVSLKGSGPREWKAVVLKINDWGILARSGKI